MPAPPYSGGKTVPSRPSLPSSLIVDRGKSPASSHFITLGAISRSANSRTVFLSCCCSSFSRKSKIPPMKRKLHIPRYARDDKVLIEIASVQKQHRRAACPNAEL